MIIILRFLNSLMDGGVDTGFNHVEPEQYKPRLLKVSGSSKKVQVTEVSLRNSSWSSQQTLILREFILAILLCTLNMPSM